MKSRSSFLTGCEDFAELITSGAFYVDKTAYLKTLFMSDSEAMNLWFMRPRRFGKTLNLSMIKEFCRLNYLNPGDKSYQEKLFVDNGRNLEVAGDEYRELREKVMGAYPVISVSFKTVEGVTFADALAHLLYKVGMLYDEFKFLIKSPKQNEFDIKNFNDRFEFSLTMTDKLDEERNLKRAIAIIKTTIPRIGEMLYKEYGRPVLVMIDEYDVPLQKAVTAKEPYYDEMLDVIRVISGNTFKKDNLPWLYKGIVSGCLRIAHQSVFTDANNFTTYGVNRKPYTGFFGFTEKETLKLLSDTGLSDKEEKVRKWYDGYRFGDKQVYCPWSLVSYCAKARYDPNAEPEAYWVNTSGNDPITLFTKNSMEAHNAGNIDRLQQLMDGGSVDFSLREFTTYPDVRNDMDFDVFMTMMLHTGYVTYADKSPLPNDIIRVRIPNREVKECFAAKQKYLYGTGNSKWFRHALELVDFLLENRAEEAQSLISSMLKQFLSVRNSGSELYYHGFMTGLLGMGASSQGVDFLEEHESGDGYSDIILDDYRKKTVCILELKRAARGDDSLKAAEDAALQIKRKAYADPYLKKRYRRVYAMGLGFARKSCEIVSLGDLATGEA